MLPVIEKATLATESQNWTLVNQYLGELPLEKKNQKLIKLKEAHLRQVLAIALQVLKYGDFQQRWEIARFFRKLGKTAITPLIKIIQDEEADAEFRWFAVRILGDFSQPEVVIALVKLLQKTEDEDLATVVAQALANIGDSAIEALSQLLTNTELRPLAASALAYMRRPQVVEPLLSIVDDPNPEVRATAIEALGSFHSEKITPVLINALQDTAAIVRKEAVIALGFQAPHINLTSWDLVSSIEPLLYDLNLEVCQKAAIAMGRISNEEAIIALGKLLNSSTTSLPLQVEVVRALGWTGKALALKFLQEKLVSSPGKVCEEIVRMMGRWEVVEMKLQVSQILIDFLQKNYLNQESKIQQLIATSLGKLSNKNAIPWLEKLADKPDKTLQLHALAALKKLGVN